MTGAHRPRNADGHTPARPQPGGPARTRWSPPTPHPRRRRRTARRGPLRAYGPLVYVVPALLVLTFLTVLDVIYDLQDTSGPQSAEPVDDDGPTPAMSNPGGPTVQADSASTDPHRTAVSAELSPGGPFPTQGAGTFHVVPGTSDQVSQGQLTAYTIEAEDGITFTDGDTAFATAVQATLSHPKSWTGNGTTALRRIDTGTPDLRITLASQTTARSLLQTQRMGLSQSVR